MSSTSADRRLTFHSAGDRAVLVEPADSTDVASLTHVLRSTPVPGVSDVLPAAQTVLITVDPHTDVRAFERRLSVLLDEFDATSLRAVADGDVVRVPVTYDGADLGEVARILGISTAEVIAEHTRRTWRCSFVGFAPGFGYLESSETGLSVPRRHQSRTAVPAGSIALADGYSAVYPRRSPGGWQLIGRTSTAVWDTDRAQPALITPGCTVQFFAEDPR